MVTTQKILFSSIAYSICGITVRMEFGKAEQIL